MEELFSLERIQRQGLSGIEELRGCNALTVKYGLVLSEGQMEALVKGRFDALRDTGRIEFGPGILKKLIYAFCDSPYIRQDNYLDTMIELQDAFYYFKNESHDRLPDDELIEYMKAVFDAGAQGSTEYLAGTSLENLCRGMRGGEREEDDEDEFWF